MARTKLNELAEHLFHQYAVDWAGDDMDSTDNLTWEELPSNIRGNWERDAKDIIYLLKGHVKKIKELSE